MKLFTILSDINQEKIICQVEAQSIEDATKDAIGRLPFYDEIDISEEDYEIISSILEGKIEPTFLKVDHCQNTWLWKEGLTQNEKIISYIFKTEKE